MFSIHSYRHITRPVEINPWLDGIGRGTFINAVNKVYKAISYSKNPQLVTPDHINKPTYLNKDNQKNITTSILGKAVDVLSYDATIAVETQSSEMLSQLSNESINCILTDPPYFDNLSYSELSDFYLSWHQSLGMALPPYDNNSLSAPISDNLAVIRRSAKDIAEYQEKLQRIFSECYRVLRADGICVFTYHHKSLQAWLSLGTALLRSGFKITKVLPMRGEGQGGLHSHTGTIKWDAVLVCRKGNRYTPDAKISIKKEAIEWAVQEAKNYFDDLNIHSHIGFNEPDYINLASAMIISRCEFFDGALAMSDALNAIPAIE